MRWNIKLGQESFSALNSVKEVFISGNIHTNADIFTIVLYHSVPNFFPSRGPKLKPNGGPRAKNTYCIKIQNSTIQKQVKHVRKQILVVHFVSKADLNCFRNMGRNVLPK